MNDIEAMDICSRLCNTKTEWGRTGTNEIKTHHNNCPLANPKEEKQ
tara:strand:- start:568 stop:705 length:138 start_codon:yes stop_codon:yes gene_type:complete